MSFCVKLIPFTQYFQIKLMADSIQKVSNFVSFTESSNPSSLTNVNNTLYFTANDGTTGSELWRINSSGNAELVADINPGSGSSNPNNLTNFNNTLYFTANDGTSGSELWRINSSGNAEQVANFNPGSSASSISKLTAVGDKLYVTASDGNAFQIWSLGQSAPSITSVSTDDRGYQQGENLDFTGTFSLDSGSAVLPVT